MRPRTAASAALVLVMALAAAAQPPKDVPQPMPPKKADGQPADSTDATIAAALANDPDVRTAQARIQLAEAELAKARLVAAQRALAAREAVRAAQSAVLVAENDLLMIGMEYKRNAVPNAAAQPDYRSAVAKLEAAKSKAATAEAEWRLLTEGPKRSAVPHTYRDKDGVERSLLAFLSERDHRSDAAMLAYLAALELKSSGSSAVKGPVPDRIRAALDKPVRIGAKGAEVPFAKAVEIINQETGLGISVRGNYAVPPITSQGEELPVGAWFQMFQDLSGGTFYVREYGLLVVDPKAAPPDAPTITQFWKQKPADAPAPKPAAGAPK